MMARLYTGCQDVISIRNGYHGNAAGTMGATAQGSYKFNVVQVYNIMGACPFVNIVTISNLFCIKGVRNSF